jgi:hypothetical protein
MRIGLICLAAGLLLATACSKQGGAPPAAANGVSAASPAAVAAAPAPAVSGPAVSGVFMGDGKQAALTEVTAHRDDPFDGKPVTALVFSEKDQAGSSDPKMDAVFGQFGSAMVVRVEPDGTVIGADIVHSGLGEHSVSISGVLKIENFSMAGGQISGHLTSGGDNDVFDHKLNVDLTFHAKAA